MPELRTVRVATAKPPPDDPRCESIDCDLRVGMRAKRWFDSVGHYSREDVLLGM